MVGYSPKLLHFRVNWKKNYHAKAPAVVMDYQAVDLKSLMAILFESEQVTVETTEFIYVHLIPPNGNPQEVFCHEQKRDPVNVNDDKPGAEIIRLNDIRQAMTDYRKRKNADARAVAETQQKAVLNRVGELLKRAGEIRDGGSPGRVIVPATASKPRIRLKTVNAPSTTGGYFYTAYEAKAN